MRDYAIIPTYNRHTEVRRLVDTLRKSNVTVCVIDNASDPPVFNDTVDSLDEHIIALSIETKPPELYRFWNVALDEIARREHRDGRTEWNVAVFNDDAVVPDGWWETVRAALRGEGSPIIYAGTNTPAIVCTDAYGVLTEPLLHTQPDNNLVYRMCPWAWMTRGELGLRADERFKWWWGDTDLDWQARLKGGVLILPGLKVVNEHADSSTHGELMEQAGRDGEAFVAKWGSRPW